MSEERQVGQGAAPLTCESAQVILEALRAACHRGDEHDPVPGPSPVRVGFHCNGAVAAWRACMPKAAM